MTITKEMYRRINSMMPQQQNQIAKLLQQGYSAAKIRSETGATMKQINAVAAWVQKYMGAAA
jgi:uncharacterized protein YerC